MSQSKRFLQLSEAEIRSIYAQGEVAVVSLVTQLLERLNSLEAEVKELQGRLSKDSRNSSKPPSSDGFGKRTNSLRRKSEKSSGGQAGHQGQTLEWRREPDVVERHRVEVCRGCGSSLATVAAEEVLARQVFDLPPIELKVSEHQVEVKSCPHCGQVNQGSFPPEAATVVQYGPRIKGMMVYLMEGQLLPSNRVCETLRDLVGVMVSEGTLYTSREQCFEDLTSIESAIQRAIQDSDVVHFDETGLRVNQCLWWLHVAATDGLTYYFVHPKRGQAAMNEMGILPEFRGHAVHDGWKSYQGYECEHVLCNAHHLRELQFILEHYGQAWAFQMSLLLVTIYHWVETLKAEGKSALPSADWVAFEARYQAILKEGFAANPLPAPVKTRARKRGRPKRSPPRNLLERLQQHQGSVLSFMQDFRLPFDNNQAERDLRMMKLKQKISGSFRSEDGARQFCRIRGYLATLRKQGLNVLDALFNLFAGNPQSPLPQPE
ncbi:IS66 family transposase [Leptodesmis sichuanensis]|uniref:IS66 family transposase n=1 Tax=Leptodesmis sichuanensis TaxID=2906798 RepID=UPI001F26BAE4|nr:IS66 family transposase [Leptodesmis sichuanensis]UIE37562.1 IS66 family transposase [Leptodesmis sichuanensis A121]UIE37750.1 IS66 family transposase [Leptodesmis sichuanensis A121]UIE38182.1 IS66 family transposase [Leptodesmis sichuanensis A121]